MSDIRINVCPPEEATEKSAAKKRKKKDRWFRKKMQLLAKKGLLEGKLKDGKRQPSNEQANLQNGASTNQPAPPASSQHETVLPLSSASHCVSRPAASTQSKPSLTFTVTNNRMPSTKPTTSASGAGKPTTSAATGSPAKYLAMDCEMVGAGPKGSISQLARCSIVSYEGDVVYDKFINPSMPVTDYRTRWSGIRRSDLFKATPFTEARKEILKLLMGKVVIGHAVHNDFKVLSYSHPAALIRDTSRIPLLNKKAGFSETECASLKRLTKAIFNRDIQTGKKGHSSVEDAKATMELYKVVEEEWERKLAAKSEAT